jgi:hypothetical protein
MSTCQQVQRFKLFEGWLLPALAFLIVQLQQPS